MNLMMWEFFGTPKLYGVKFLWTGQACTGHMQRDLLAVYAIISPPCNMFFQLTNFFLTISMKNLL